MGSRNQHLLYGMSKGSGRIFEYGKGEDGRGPIAKKRRLEWEFEREQAKLEEQRKVEDIRQQSQRQQKDLPLQIEYQRQLEGLKSPGKSNLKPTFSSSINYSDDEIRPRGPWPKISITPLNGDSRTCPDF
jgi:hypothetical protein